MAKGKRKVRIVLLVLVGLLILLSPFIYRTVRNMGKNPSGERLEKIKLSPHYSDDSFQNLEPTVVTLPDVSFMKLLGDAFSRPEGVTPSQKIPSVKTDLKNINNDRLTVIWFGHSSYLINHKDFNILIDPMFSSYAAPMPVLVKAFDGTEIYQAADFPHLNAIIISHDHYDHLDYQTIKDLQDQTDQFIVPLGIGSHLAYWGVAPEKIVEMDWDQTVNLGIHIDLTAAPARHFSGRAFDRGKTFWNAYVLNLQGYKVFLGGEGGYGKHIKSNGERYGPFDLAILENGQYDLNWPYIHMFPEQTANAAKELRAKVLMPVHWSKFPLANHPWNEPVKRLVKAAADIYQPVITPLIGEPYSIGDSVKVNTWWDVEF